MFVQVIQGRVKDAAAVKVRGEAWQEEVAPGVRLPFIHRPLHRYVNAMARHGLLIERMEEPAPPEGFLDRAAEYREAATIPRLLFLVARKLEG